MTAQVAEILETEHGDLFMDRQPGIPGWPKSPWQNVKVQPLPDRERGLYRSTGCQRMYRGTWCIRNGGLYLVTIKCAGGLLRGAPILATWYSGEFSARARHVPLMLFGEPSLEQSGRVLDVDVKNGRIVSMVERHVQDGQPIIRRLGRRESPGRRERRIRALVRLLRSAEALFSRGSES